MYHIQRSSSITFTMMLTHPGLLTLLCTVIKVKVFQRYEPNNIVEKCPTIHFAMLKKHLCIRI